MLRSMIKVKETSYTRELKLCAIFEKYLEQVKEFKALRKLEDLFFIPKDKENPKCLNDRMITDYAFTITRSYYENLKWNFYLKNHKSDSETLSFDIEKKDIPSVIKGLEKYKGKLTEGEKKENEVSIDTYPFRDLTNRIFNGEFTEKQFSETKKELVKYLEKKTKEVKNLKY